MITYVRIAISVDDSKAPLRQCGEDCPFNDTFEYCQLFGVPMDKDDAEMGGRVRLCVHAQIAEVKP
jgi:hypothetical protein